MKIKRLCPVALLVIISLGTLTPVVAWADGKSLTSKGSVNYTEDDSTNLLIDPENPNKEITPGDEVTVNEAGGPITIDAVSNLDFGLQKIGTSAASRKYKAAAVETTQAGDVAITRGHFIQWTDKRAGTNHKYEIKANLTQQFINGPDVLQGATIAYSNGMLNSPMPQENWPAATPQNIILTEDGGATQVFNNMTSTAAIGLGTYTAEYGQSTKEVTNARGDISTGLAEESVILTVPTGLSIVKGTYRAEITWSIESSP